MFEVGEMFFGEGQDFFICCFYFWFEDDGGVDFFVLLGIGKVEDCYFGDFGMIEQGVFYFFGEDVFFFCFDYVFQVVDEVYEFFFVFLYDIFCMKLVVDECGCGFFVLFVVFFDYGWFFEEEFFCCFYWYLFFLMVYDLVVYQGVDYVDCFGFLEGVFVYQEYCVVIVGFCQIIDIDEFCFWYVFQDVLFEIVGEGGGGCGEEVYMVDVVGDCFGYGYDLIEEERGDDDDD